MKKTTIYLNEKELKDLKMLAARLATGSAADLIRQAVRDFLRNKNQPSSFVFLKKHLQKKPVPTSFGDAVTYQRSLRKEWH